MHHIFYLIGIGFIINQLMWILHPNQRIQKHRKFKEHNEINKGRKLEDWTEEYKGLLIFTAIPSVVFLLWLLLGLLSFNWFLFLGIITWNTVVIWPLSKLSEYSRAHTALHWLNSVIGFVFGLFVIVNAYHLKIDVYDWFIKAFFG